MDGMGEKEIHRENGGTLGTWLNPQGVTPNECPQKNGASVHGVDY